MVGWEEGAEVGGESGRRRESGRVCTCTVSERRATFERFVLRGGVLHLALAFFGSLFLYSILGRRGLSCKFRSGSEGKEEEEEERMSPLSRGDVEWIWRRRFLRR